MNKRSLLAITIATASALCASAVPAKPGLTRTVKQSDGTELTLSVGGDERFHSYTTSDHLSVTRGADGNYYYLTPQGISSVVAHPEGARSADEITFIQQNQLAPAAVAQTLARPKMNTASGISQRAGQVSPKVTTQVPTTASPKGPVLLLAYKDYAFRDGADALTTFQDFFDEGDVSARQYFKDQSGGQYTPQFDVYGPYTLSQKRSYYGANDYSGDDVRVGTMVGEGVLGLNSQIDFSQYDNDGDGVCDVVIVIYAGDGEASSYDDDADNAIWPCQWTLSSSDYGQSLTCDGVKVNAFAVFNELNGSDLTKIDGIGTFCHEYGHCMGLPDFYDTYYSGNFGMGPWSIMDYGNYNNDGYTPLGYSAYEKEFMGWYTIPEATENTFYTLPAWNNVNTPNDQAIKLTSSNANEYFILENRQQQCWDEYMPAAGLMITHVTYSSAAWNGNYVNNNYYYSGWSQKYDTVAERMTIMPADNSKEMEKWGSYYYIVDDDCLGDLWPYKGNDAFTDSSSPAAALNLTSSYLGKPITEITQNADGTVSFWCMKEETPKTPIDTPVLNEGDVVSSTSFTASWTHDPGEAEVTYSLEVRLNDGTQPVPTLVNSASFASAQGNDWTDCGTNKYYAIYEDNSIRLGSSKYTGYVISPTFTTDEDGVVTLWFNAKAYGNDTSVPATLYVLDQNGNTLASSTQTLTSSAADYCAKFTVSASTKVQVKIASETTKKRINLYTAKIYTGDASDDIYKSRTREVSDTGDQTRRLITGIEGSSYTVTDLKEGAIYTFRVKAVPADTDTYEESPWTDMLSVDLSDTSAVHSIINNDLDQAPVYYNLQGIRIPFPTAGQVVIRKQGSSATKILIQ